MGTRLGKWAKRKLGSHCRGQVDPPREPNCSACGNDVPRHGVGWPPVGEKLKAKCNVDNYAAMPLYFLQLGRTKTPWLCHGRNVKDVIGTSFRGALEQAQRHVQPLDTHPCQPCQARGALSSRCSRIGCTCTSILANQGARFLVS